MTTIKPTLGRVVWFTPSNLGILPEVPTDRDGRCTALITYVHSDTLVNLAVFDANGEHHAKTSVPLLKDGEPKPAHGYHWEWMPYQLGQAAKAECLQQVVDAARKGFSDVPTDR